MSGRHRPGGPDTDVVQPRRRRKPAAIFAVAVLAVAVATGVVLLGGGPRDGAHAARSHKPCSIGMPLQVVTTADFATPLRRVVHQWEADGPEVGGLCINVSVAIQDPLAAEQSLITSKTPTLWIPDSTVWSARLLSDAPNLAGNVKVIGSVANSPLVLATTPGHAASLNAVAHDGWLAALNGDTTVSLPDPTTSATGVLALLAMQGQQGQSDNSGPSHDELTSDYVELTGHTVSSSDVGLQILHQKPATAPAVVAAEQQVFAAEQSAPGQLTSVFPKGATLALNYPLVSIDAGDSDQYTEAVHKFALAMQTSSATSTFNASGYRDAGGDPLPNTPGAAAIDPDAFTPSTTATTVTNAIRLWVSASTPVQLLAVIDVSGSMNDSAGDGQTKIQLASQAAVTAMTFIPDSWSVGLWSFAQHAAPDNDWTELSAIRPVSSSRASLITAARKLPSQVKGNTGLYDTALAAFEQVRGQYAKGRVNSIVLMTDGANQDPGGMSLSTLLATLSAQYSSSQPVHITTIALGKDADVGALQKISTATGGVTYIVQQPKDVRTVLMRSILNRS